MNERTKSDTKARRLAELLKGHSAITLREAMDALGVSESTARRIFARLERDGCGVRYHGGIELISDSVIPDYSFDDMKSKFVREKRAAARYAAGEVCEGDRLFIDSGTTLKHFSFALAALLEKKEISSLKIYTASLANFGALRDLAEVFLIGGSYRPLRKDFCGEIALGALSRLKLDKCFIGCDGFHPSCGFTTTDRDSAEIADTVMENSLKSYMVMDSGKFMKVSVVPFAKRARSLTVVTDREPCRDALQGISGLGAALSVCKNGF